MPTSHTDSVQKAMPLKTEPLDQISKQPVLNGDVASAKSKIDSIASINFKTKGLNEFNELISCHLCKGYLIDATTIVECLHSFCRTCIIQYLDESNPKFRFCPKCDVQIHKTKPKVNIRADPTLQDIVYKLVPGLFKSEMLRRKEYYLKSSDKAIGGLSNEEKGEINGERLILSTDDLIQISIEYYPQFTNPYELLPFKNDKFQSLKNTDNANQRRYLLCKGGMRVLHLKKFIKNKYDLNDKDEVDLFYKQELLRDEYSIIDLAYIYSWRRHIPIPLYYVIIEQNKKQIDYLLLSNVSLNLTLPCKKSIRRKLPDRTQSNNTKKLKQQNSNLVSNKNPTKMATPSSSIEISNTEKNPIANLPNSNNESCKSNNNDSLMDDSSTDVSEKSFHIDLDVQTDSPNKESNSENSLDSNHHKQNGLSDSLNKNVNKSELTTNQNVQTVSSSNKSVENPNTKCQNNQQESKIENSAKENTVNEEIKENDLNQSTLSEKINGIINSVEKMADTKADSTMKNSTIDCVTVNVDSCKAISDIKSTENDVNIQLPTANKVTTSTENISNNIIRPFVFANIENTDDFKKLLYSQINSTSSTTLNLDDKLNHSVKSVKLD